ncbi:hypothetical protein TRFO_27579 [Tritrichomonas foetus]|uniref:Leucine Rich Repeat family protein n=1 Tax=Tritrichomonas foetus TaxID=1144522 RepID=A0A1J4K0B3_9EUKA|nr:hypothetical protein TRFO_27579 [Tritrichomonas foetus]|eukprot:OHT04855.1 hypothetical protein TRFO_27579 [Tritrichomonas foetus]
MKTIRPPRRANSVKPVSKKSSPIFAKNRTSRPNDVQMLPSDIIPGNEFVLSRTHNLNLFAVNHSDVSHQNLVDFSFLSEPVRTLNASYNAFRDFSGFPSNFRTVEIDVSDSNIENFNGAKEVIGHQTLKLYRCPISEHSGYRVAALIAFGQSIKTIDGEPVKVDERQLAYRAAHVTDLVRRGWIPDSFPVTNELAGRIRQEMQEASGEAPARSPVKPMIRRRTNIQATVYDMGDENDNDTDHDRNDRDSK